MDGIQSLQDRISNIQEGMHKTTRLTLPPIQINNIQQQIQYSRPVPMLPQQQLPPIMSGNQAPSAHWCPQTHWQPQSLVQYPLPCYQPPCYLPPYYQPPYYQPPYYQPPYYQPPYYQPLYNQPPYYQPPTIQFIQYNYQPQQRFF
ncbi:unnamed protein product [Rotaria sp. Silwood1]|nr:unnamed protein product [Rotaria sp. Silwood1]CAF1691859.1 unnamed protein product [Rotaria sp. Silwood1]